MAFDWHISALPAIISALLSWTLAFVVYRTRPERFQNRVLAAFLAIAGAGLFVRKGMVPLSDNPSFALGATLAFLALFHIGHMCHLLFLSTLETAVVRPLATRAGRTLIIATGLALALSVAIFPQHYLSGAVPSSVWPGWWAEPGWLFGYFAALYVVLFLYGVLVAWMAYAASTSASHRARNRAYLTAFIVHDGGMAVLLPTLAFAGPHMAPGLREHLFHWLPSAFNIWMVCWLTYGILRTQLFDIDIRVRRGVSLGTALTIMAVFPLALREAAAASHTPLLTNLLTAATFVALMGIVLVLRPTIDRAVVGSVAAAEVDAKKIDVYRAALAEAGHDQASQRVLARLRWQLGLSDRDHALLTHAGGGRAALAPGHLFVERFRIVESLGRGGQAQCFLAHDEALGRRVVLKQFPQGQVGAIESRALARLRHRNVVSLHDVLRVGESTYLVMEYMEGRSLADRLGGDMDEADWKRLCKDALGGLAALHEAGLVHGDIKPANILLRNDGSAALADLGAVIDTSATMPATATSAGTLQYLSPERAKGEPAGVADDLWALAATLYEARSGKPLVKVWDADQPHDVRRRVASYDQAPADVPPWLKRALARDPAVRPPSARDMLEIAEGRPDHVPARSTYDLRAGRPA